ncbi:TIGR01459 family HAD-type hydrolase [Oceaniglobus ichthyenteri]|uniref:TIGR01459 family HAD-type hydrolase n=1 Tax=Oceaniglobus ichthyenteri TaxID=2136177 RepID=UPI0013DDF44A|nr:TIGR01459 family HAD-type hydrolase [Oceaniglobus ichthyenteri]
MTRFINSIVDIAEDYDAIVFDQWGVLHDGSAPYPFAIDTLNALKAKGTVLAVLSNSGKRAAPNAKRIASFGFKDMFSTVMTSGEALWQGFSKGMLKETRLFAIERDAGDAMEWAQGLALEFTGIEQAEAILLMGLPENAAENYCSAELKTALAKSLTVYCSNPDRASPRAGGTRVIAPGTLAHEYAQAGGPVTFYGKPHRAVFDALQAALGCSRILMVGDSIEHDIAGGTAAGWDTLLVQGGLYKNEFASQPASQVLASLCAKYDAAAPTYQIELLS